MTLEALWALPVAAVAADEAHLFLWVMRPKAEEAHRLITAWSFSYRAQMVWVKDAIGMGYYVRQQHELFYIARRGTFPVPLEEARPSSVIQAPRGRRHSEKPEGVAELTERMYRTASKVELFSRAPRPGWVAWGVEAAA